MWVQFKYLHFSTVIEKCFVECEVAALAVGEVSHVGLRPLEI